MKVYIDFSIFLSAAGAYGNVTGYIELPSFPKIGDRINLFNDDASKRIECLGSLRVQSITPVPSYGADKAVVGLEDIVVSSIETARNLAKKLETECGLFCVEYE